MNLIEGCQRINRGDRNFFFWKCRVKTPGKIYFSYGVDSSEKEAKKKAFLEGMERYCIDFQETKTDRGILKSYKEIKNKAVNPQLLFPFSDAQYSQKGFKYQKLEEEDKIYWLKGQSLLSKNTVYVPTSYVYCNYSFRKFEKRLGRSTSNGCAINRNLREAILHGILELIERDDVLIHWFNKLPAPRIDLEHLPAKLKNIFEDVKKRYRVNVLINDQTIDFKIPIFSVLLSGNRIPYYTFGSAADFSAEKAIIKALQESLLIREELKSLKRINSRYNNLNCIQNLYQHAEFYALRREAAKAFNFLIHSPPSVDFKKYQEIISKYRTKSKQLSYLKKACQKAQKDIIFIEFSSQLTRRMGLRAVRVIIPGLQPLNSEYNCRYLGNERLYTQKKVRLNVYPHPIG